MQVKQCTLQYMNRTLLILVAAASVHAQVTIEQRFAEAKRNPAALYAFLVKMPKGGDLHNHLTGAVYAETFLRIAAEDGLCVDTHALAIVAPPCGAGMVDAARAQTDNTLASQVIDSLSMRDFVPGRESGHDHFFATFAKFGPYKQEHRGELIAEVAGRAADQNESYMELMILNGNAANDLGKAAGFNGDFEAAKDKLMSGGLKKVVDEMRVRVDEMEQQRVRALGCEQKTDARGCDVTVRYIYQVLREAPKEQAFAQVLAGFMLADSDSRVVGVNFVQPEDGYNSMHDYHLQMQMVDYAKKLYPKVHITLHAGELSAGLVPPEGLRFHIREAVELGHAERIGHGVDVMYEKDAFGLLNEMRKRKVMVEINLTSNDLILGVRGKDHPFPVYRKYGVPVALSTDDEGVSRGHLTEEYVRAALTYDLTYAQLKEMVRNSIEYSFLPGASYWQDRTYKAPAPSSVLKTSEKARVQADLEERFRKFEK